ncbi:hypothetical protein Syun_002581 [Stephania yunnanensis]|uniref:GDSL esterase/lipase n=1 Tax=Stephania yunnanensis TaxID=152371 RepID=A0AAP0QBZ0_9MAGN
MPTRGMTGSRQVHREFLMELPSPASQPGCSPTAVDAMESSALKFALELSFTISDLAELMSFTHYSTNHFLDHIWDRIRDGLNFAYGGTGVFDTISPEPNMTTQIDFFQKLIQSNVYSKQNLSSSVALVSLAGNDYNNYITFNGSIQGLPGFIVSVVNQLALNLKRIHDFGVKKVAVNGLQPLGCLPRGTASSSYQRCNGTENMAVGFHNSLLKEAVAKLNTESKSSAFVILDLYMAFTTVFNTSQNHPDLLQISDRFNSVADLSLTSNRLNSVAD